MFGDNGSWYALPHVAGEERHQPALWRQMPARLRTSTVLIGGVIKHASHQRPANPTTNLYKLPGPGLRSAGDGLLPPATVPLPPSVFRWWRLRKARRIEGSLPDPAANPYSALPPC